MSSDLYEIIEQLQFERNLADMRAFLNSEIANGIEKDYAALKELKALCDELERRLESQERVN